MGQILARSPTSVQSRRSEAEDVEVYGQPKNCSGVSVIVEISQRQKALLADGGAVVGAMKYAGLAAVSYFLPESCTEQLNKIGKPLIVSAIILLAGNHWYKLRWSS